MKKRLIDANDALERLRKVEPKLHVVDYLGFKAVDIDAFIRFLESQKTVSAVEVVNGRWEHIQTGRMLHVRCTACGVDAIKINTDRFTELTVAWNYCPNCGAKMDGDGNA